MTTPYTVTSNTIGATEAEIMTAAIALRHMGVDLLDCFVESDDAAAMFTIPVDSDERTGCCGFRFAARRHRPAMTAPKAWPARRTLPTGNRASGCWC